MSSILQFCSSYPIRRLKINRLSWCLKSRNRSFHQYSIFSAATLSSIFSIPWGWKSRKQSKYRNREAPLLERLTEVSIKLEEPAGIPWRRAPWVTEAKINYYKLSNQNSTSIDPNRISVSTMMIIRLRESPFWTPFLILWRITTNIKSSTPTRRVRPNKLWWAKLVTQLLWDSLYLFRW
jgi:hypothetical protein